MTANFNGGKSKVQWKDDKTPKELKINCPALCLVKTRALIQGWFSWIASFNGGKELVNRKE
jgi:hypothetical protein